MKTEKPSFNIKRARVVSYIGLFAFLALITYLRANNAISGANFIFIGFGAVISIAIINFLLLLYSERRKNPTSNTSQFSS